MIDQLSIMDAVLMSFIALGLEETDVAAYLSFQTCIYVYTNLLSIWLYLALYAGIHHSKYWMPSGHCPSIMTPSKMGKTKISSLFSNSICIIYVWMWTPDLGTLQFRFHYSNGLVGLVYTPIYSSGTFIYQSTNLTCYSWLPKCTIITHVQTGSLI